MEYLKCIIIDDETKDRENLKLLLKNYCPNAIVVSEANEPDGILNLLKNSEVDLVFLDIQIGPNTIFDIINDLDNINFKIVFVTAYDQYAIKGYTYNAMDYLLKPVDKDKLIAVVDKTLSLKKEDQLKTGFLKEFKNMYASIADSPKISIADSKGVHILEINDLMYCKSDGNYTTLYLSSGREILISKNLKQFEEKLPYTKFLRIHKSYLINLNFVDILLKEQGGAVILKNGTSLPISRNGKKELIKKMNLI